MSEPRKCGNCGAVAARADDRFCAYCGTELPRPEPAQTVRVEVVGPFGDLDERFERLKAHPSYAQWMRRTPSTAGHAIGLYGGAIFAVFFIVVSLFITSMFGALAGPMAIFPLGFVAVGVFLLVKMLGRANRYTSAPLLRTPAAVLDERTEVSGGGKNSSASTPYYATLQPPDRLRHEFAADGRTAGDVTRGDVGIAYLKSDVLVEFQRVDV